MGDWSARHHRIDHGLVTRRNILRGAFGGALAGILPEPKAAWSQDKAPSLSPQCSVSTGDSLSMYSELLDHIQQDAFNSAAKALAEQLAISCNHELGVISEALAAYRKDLFTGRVTDNLGRVDNLVEQVKKQQDMAVSAAQASQKWGEMAKQVVAQIDGVRSDLDAAGTQIVKRGSNVFAPTGRVISDGANELITDAIEKLNQIDTGPHSMARDTLLRLLQVVQEAGERNTYYAFRSDTLMSATSEAGLRPGRPIFPTSDDVGSDLKDKVLVTVRNPNYFVPGGTVQYWAVLAVCFPIWIVYDRAPATREQLIGGSVFVVRGIKREKVNEIAHALAVAS